MGIFSFTKEIAIDLGTANTIIIHNDKIVIDEPSIVALDTKTGKLIAVGTEAQQMQGKEPEGIPHRASAAQRRNRRLQCRRTYDSRTRKKSEHKKQMVLTFPAYGCRNPFRLY